MIAEQLKKAILQAAIQGKLTEQLPDDGKARALLEEIQKEKASNNEGKSRKEKKSSEVYIDQGPYDIPDSWCWVRLCEVGEIIGGGTPKTEDKLSWLNGSIPWLTPADMKNIKGKYVDCGGRLITEYGLKNSSARLLPKGSVLFSSRAPIGYIAIASNPLTTNQGFKSVVPYINKMSEYIYYYLMAISKEIEKMGSGTTFKEVSGAIMKEILIPLPPIAEQFRIIEQLERLLPEIDNLKNDEFKLDSLQKSFPKKMKDSILQYAIQGKLTEQIEEDGDARDLRNNIETEKSRLVFEGKLKKEKPLDDITEDEIPFDIPENWCWARLGNVFNVTMGQSPDGNSVAEGGSGIEFHQGKVFFGENYIQKSNQTTTKPTKIVEPNTILICVRAPVGNTNITERKICIGRGLCGINVMASMNEKFVLYMLRVFKQDLIKKATGTTFIAITGEVLKNQLIPLPPLKEQNRILEHLENLIPLCETLE